MTKWKVGDWAVFDRDIVQIKKIDDGEWFEVSDGSFNTFGRLEDRLRPLTLSNKRIAETFDYYYKEIDKIKGSGGFNFPDISRYFSQLMLDAIDVASKEPFEKVQEFVREAGKYNPEIHGISLFR